MVESENLAEFTYFYFFFTYLFHPITITIFILCSFPFLFFSSNSMFLCSRNVTQVQASSGRWTGLG